MASIIGKTMTEFSFNKQPEETKWLLEPFIPMGHLCLVLAQAGVGKSLFVESLATCVVYGTPFCDFNTIQGDVLIIDQDTPINTLEKRLMQFSTAINAKRKHKLFLESMQGFSLSDNTLISIINDYPSVVLIIIDSLHSVVGKLNPNYTSDMSILAKVKRKCLDQQKSIIINHHISEKRENVSVDNLMQGNTNQLSMGASTIIQQADTYYIVGADTVEGKTDRLYVRPVSKRVSIKSKPLVIKMLPSENGTGEAVLFDGYYEPDLEQIEEDILILFQEQQLDRTVKEVYEGMGHKHGEKAVRKALAILETKGRVFVSKHKSNLFKYKIPH